MTTNGKLTTIARRLLPNSTGVIVLTEAFLCRPRELKLKEKEATSLTPCHDTVASRTGTSKRRDVPPLDTHLARSADTIGPSSPREEPVRALAE